ncbi:MAG TPA: AAA family ATPase [Micromonosporaceae bacterium]
MPPDTETVDQLILEHLDDARLPGGAENLIYAALLGDQELDDVLGGAATHRPARETGSEASEPVGTYLAAIEVTGFRGIGPTATLNLTPAPGLTIITGRNGSGKSSFAEAAEYVLTGDNKRWSGRTRIWQEGWRNLHTSENPRIRVRLGMEGKRNGATVECHWPATGALSDGTSFLQVSGERQQKVADLGWDKPLELYRPFLSYAELGGLLSGKPSEMHDSLQKILGLGRLVDIETMLKTARRDMDQRRGLGAARLPELTATLAAHPDPRARQAEQVLAGRTVDLDQLEALATAEEPAGETNVVPLRQLDVLDLPSREEVVADVERLREALRVIAELAGTPVEESRAVAALLNEALAHYDGHPDQPCPVCGGRTLDRAWAEQARAELRRLTERAERLDRAHQVERAARQALRERLQPVPAALSVDLSADGVETDDLRVAWQHWDELVRSDRSEAVAEAAVAAFEALTAAAQPVQAAARQALERRQQAWQPVADGIRDWVHTERSSRHAAEMHRALQKALDWLRGVGDEIRNEKLAPVAEQAMRIWNTLRQESNVDLGAIRLAGTGPNRHVDLRVNVDGVPGAALSVMSQGELHSLALALFLPRATMPESPFRFLVIDDPVQSMDPVKVYGLAKVLAEVAEHRQVIVFTHDDRLPAAVRHLQLPARVLAVSRLAQSQVMVTGERGDPARRYLDDASAIALDEEMADTVRVPVVCTLIRDAIEYTCHERIRVRGFRSGTSIVDTEAAISEAQGLRPTLALALLGDAKRVSDLADALRRLHMDAGWVVGAANSGAHGSFRGEVGDLVRAARRVVERLAQV